MKSISKGALSLFNLNNLLSVVFCGYVGLVIKNFYSMSQVPVATDESVKANRVMSHIVPDQRFDLHVYISKDTKFEPSKALHIGTFKDAVYSEGMCSFICAFCSFQILMTIPCPHLRVNRGRLLLRTCNFRPRCVRTQLSSYIPSLSREMLH
jgi:hypothetical protein